MGGKIIEPRTPLAGRMTVVPIPPVPADPDPAAERLASDLEPALLPPVVPAPAPAPPEDPLAPPAPTDALPLAPAAASRCSTTHAPYSANARANPRRDAIRANARTSADPNTADFATNAYVKG